MGGALAELEDRGVQLSESERYVMENRNYLHAQLLEALPGAKQRREFLDFVLERCHVLVVAVEDEDEAWSMLATEEETGLAFHSSERLKLSLISVMPREQQDEAGRLWDKCQSLIGADAMSRLLSHIRAIKWRRRSTKPIEKVLAQQLKLNRDGLSFMKDDVAVRAEHLALIAKGEIGRRDDRDRIKMRLKSLGWLEYKFWMPAALYWGG